MINSMNSLDRNQIISILKHPLFLILIINTAIRIPYFTQPQGDDAFIVIWLAKVIQNGYLDVWLIDPLSFFGFNQYSFYPIGGILVLSFFFLIGFSFQASMFCFSFLFMLISILTTYQLGKIIFSKNRIGCLLFVFFYTTSPIFLRFTYWTSSLRGPFLAILPLTLYFLFKLVKDFTIKNSLYFLLSTILLALMHRLVIIYPIYLLAIILGIAINKWNLLKPKYLPIFFSAYLCSFIIGIMIFPIDSRKTTEFLLSNSTLLGVAWNLMIDYMLRIGLISLISIVGFISQFFSIKGTGTNSLVNSFFLSVGFFFALTSPFSLYNSLIILPWFSYYSAAGINVLLNWRRQWIKDLIGFIPVLFCFLYSFIVIALPFHFIISLIIALVSAFKIIRNQHINQRRIRNLFYFILCSSIILFTRVSVDGLIVSGDFPFNYVSNDEIIIAEYLKENNLKQEISFVYDNAVARRIQGICFQPVLFPLNYPANAYYGWISIEEIKNETTFDFSLLAKSGIPFNVNFDSPEIYYRNLLQLDLRDEGNLDIIRNNSVRFIITDTPTSGYWFTEYNKIQVPLFVSIVDVGILRVETQYLRLYEIPQ